MDDRQRYINVIHNDYEYTVTVNDRKYLFQGTYKEQNIF